MRLLVIYATLASIVDSFGHCPPCPQDEMDPFTRSLMFAGFAVKAKVLSKKIPTADGMRVYYQIEIKKTFYLEKWGADMWKVYTAPDRDSCGVDLRKNKKYLLIGWIDHANRLRIGHCGFNRRWKTITKKQKLILKRKVPDC